MIDNVIINNLGNQNKAPYELINKRARNKGLFDATSNTQITNIASGQMRTKTPIQSHSKFLKTIQPVRKTVNCIHHSKMNREPETRGFKGGFIPTELKSTDTKGQNSKSATQWQGSSDREESLSDPRWHKRPPTKGKKANTNSPKQSNTESTTKIHDAREVITKKKTEETRQNSNFSKTIFTDNRGEQTNQTEKKNITVQLKTKSCLTETEVTSNSTQTKLSGEQKSEDEVWVSRVDPTKTSQEELKHNEVPPTLTTSASLEASYEMTTEGLIATIEMATKTTESEEDTPLFQKKLQRLLDVRFIAAATKKIENSAHSLTLLRNEIGRP